LLIHTYDFSEEKNPNLQESDTIIPEYNDSGIQNFYAYLGTETGYSREWNIEFPLYSYIGFGSQPPVLILDSLYQMVPDSTLGYPQKYGFSGEAFDTIIKGFLSFRSLALITLQNAPRLISPRLDTNNWEPQLIWLNMLDIDSFIVEVSMDSTFSTSLHQFITTDTDFIPTNLPSGVRYFWRVQGKNSEGYSNWSSAWNFGENSSLVKLENDDNIPMLQIMENSIQYKADKNASLTIYNVLGEVISRFTCEGNGVSQSIRLSSLGLRGGNYFVTLQSAGNMLSSRFGLLE
jgi:hypothetical protein